MSMRYAARGILFSQMGGSCGQSPLLQWRRYLSCLAPTFRDGGCHLVLLGWRGLFAPKGTPAPMVFLLERAVLDAFDDAGFLEQIRKFGLTPAPLGAEAVATFWEADRETVKHMVSSLPRK